MSNQLNQGEPNGTIGQAPEPSPGTQSVGGGGVVGQGSQSVGQGQGVGEQAGGSVAAPQGQPAVSDNNATNNMVPPQEEIIVPEGFPPQLADMARQHGFTQPQLDAAIKFFSDATTASQQVQQQQLRELGEAHIRSWGEQGRYNLQIGQRALKMIDTDGVLTKMLNETGYGNHPAVIQSLYQLGVKLQEGGFLNTTFNRPPGKRTAAQTLYGDNHPSTDL